MTTPSKSARLRAIQATTLALLLVAGVVNFLDRSSLSVANLAIRNELHLSGTQIGALLSAFSFAYGIGQLPVGFLLDRVGPRWILGWGMALWSAAQLLTGYVNSMPMFLALRVLLGVGEGPFFPSGVKSIREWFVREERGRALATLNVSSMLGLAAAPPLLTWLMKLIGWRQMFVLVGAAGIVLAIVWIMAARQRSSTALTAEEVSYLGEEEKTGNYTLGDWFGLFGSPTIWGMMLGFGGINYTNWLYISWLPAYLQTARHVSAASSGWMAAIPFLCGGVGMLTSGWIADLLVRRGIEQVRVLRVLVVTGMLCSAIATFMVAQAATASGAVAAVSFALFFIHMAGTAAWGFVPALASSRVVGAVVSIQNFGSFMISSVAPLVTGWLLDATGSFGIALGICSTVTVGGAFIYWFGVRQPVEA